MVGAPAVGTAGSVSGIRPGQNTLGMTVTAGRRSLLVIPANWDAGWSATVNGRAVPVVRVNYVQEGVPVGPGRSVVLLRYRPAGLFAGLALSAGSVLAIDIWMLAGWRRRRLYSDLAEHPDDRPVQPDGGEVPEVAGVSEAVSDAG
jgi:hypothetical protein